MVKRQSLPIAQISPFSALTESYRTVWTNIQFAGLLQSTQVVMIASAQPKEGTTTAAANIATIAAQAGRKVLLIDANMRNPSIHLSFQKSNRAGLSQVLSNQGYLSDTVLETDTNDLFILPSGPMPRNPSELLSSSLYDQLIEQARIQFDVVFIDAPPILPVADALLMSRTTDGVVLIIDTKQTTRQIAQKATASLRQLNVNIVGVVLNRVPKKAHHSYNLHQSYVEQSRHGRFLK